MRTTLFAFIAALGLMAAPAAAQQPAPAPAPPMGRPGTVAGDSAEFEGLGLTADQRAKIKAIREQLQQQNGPLRDQIRQITGGRMFRDLSPAARDSLRPKLEPIRQQMMENGRKAHAQIEALLSPEQRQKLEQHMREHHMEGGPPPD